MNKMSPGVKSGTHLIFSCVKGVHEKVKKMNVRQIEYEVTMKLSKTTVCCFINRTPVQRVFEILLTFLVMLCKSFPRFSLSGVSHPICIGVIF